jgi:hypothetical protein
MRREAARLDGEPIDSLIGRLRFGLAPDRSTENPR